jgi:hypothetical protein
MQLLYAVTVATDKLKCTCTYMYPATNLLVLTYLSATTMAVDQAGTDGRTTLRHS